MIEAIEYANPPESAPGSRHSHGTTSPSRARVEGEEQFLQLLERLGHAIGRPAGGVERFLRRIEPRRIQIEGGGDSKTPIAA